MSSTTEVLNVQLRDQTGTAASVRLRRAGLVPAVLYGHGEANRHLAIPSSEIAAALRHQSKMVQLKGAVSDTALVSDVQLDHLGMHVLHLDLVRVNIAEMVELEVPINFHGEAVGTRNGGVFFENLHAVTVRCAAGSIPEAITLEVNDMDVDDQKTVADLTLPQGVELVTPGDTVLCNVQVVHEATEAAAEAAAESPQLVGEEPAENSSGDAS